jgi:hypothetical protein
MEAHMAVLDSIRWTMRGAAGRLTLVLGLATGLAFASLAAAPKAYADSISFGFSFGDGGSIGDDVYDDSFDDQPVYHVQPRYRHDRPRYRHPSRTVDVVERRNDTVCHLVPVEVWDGDQYVIQDVQRCRRVSRW